MATPNLHPRQHIQNHSSADHVKTYWGYPSRVVPCVNDKGTCEYLDAVYWMHTVSMLYTFILWAVIGGILFLILLLRFAKPRGETAKGLWARVWKVIVLRKRRYLLPEIRWNLFRYTTRLQVLILACLSIYLIIFSLIGITYRTWLTPIKGSTLHNTRTGLGGFSDRVGALAYALTPLTVALSTRDSILSLLTGIPYQNFNFLHRWTGKIIFAQSVLHTLGWTIVEAKLYQPQPRVYVKFIKQEYMVWGIVAQILVTFLFLGSTRWGIRMTGYEFFRKAHLVVAGVYLGACWAHWSKLACWMIASLGVLGIDLGLRVVRIGMIHFGYRDGNKGIGFCAIEAEVKKFEDLTGEIVRLEFEHEHRPWKFGQHFYITFPALSIWQGHPFTPASVPLGEGSKGVCKHVYIIRARKGETGRLAGLVSSPVSDKTGESKEIGDGEDSTASSVAKTSVILTGPYAVSVLDRARESSNLQAIAGGTGISFTLPVILSALRNPGRGTQNIEMVWIVRHTDNLQWTAPELEEFAVYLAQQKNRVGEKDSLQGGSESSTSAKIKDESSLEPTNISTSSKSSYPYFRLRIFVTRSTSSVPDSAFATLQNLPNVDITHLNGSHPSISNIMNTFLTDLVSTGATTVVGSGTAGIGTDLRSAVAEANKHHDVKLVWDDRLG